MLAEICRCGKELDYFFNTTFVRTLVIQFMHPESVREITYVLDAVDNTTKSTTKGFDIGSTALASFLLFSAYMDEVASFAYIPFKEVDIAIPEVFIGGLLGSMLIFLFRAWACSAVGRTSKEVVNEVRRQFIESPFQRFLLEGCWVLCLFFLVSAWACSAVGRTSKEVVNEGRRQFIESPGIMDYKEMLDYGRCVSIVAYASLREMIKPGALAIYRH